MPERVKDIRVLIAELQRIASHLVWLGTHALEIGAVSVMMYCFRERELLLNINEMLAGFRMFPSYLRIGGLREDLPVGFHDAVTAFLDRFPDKLEEYADLLTKNQIWLKRTKGVGVLSKDDTISYGLVGPLARAVGVDYDVRRTFPYLDYDTYDFDVPVLTAGDVYDRYMVRVEEMRQSVRISPAGARADHPARRLRHPGLPHRPAAEGQGLHRDGSADPALPDLLAGLHRAGRRGLRADRGAARRARLQHRLGRHQPSVPDEVAGAVVLRVPVACRR